MGLDPRLPVRVADRHTHTRLGNKRESTGIKASLYSSRRGEMFKNIYFKRNEEEPPTHTHESKSSVGGVVKSVAVGLNNKRSTLVCVCPVSMSGGV